MMIHTDAIYEGGLLRPLVPLSLKEQEVVSLTISSVVVAGETATGTAEAEGQRPAELDEFRRVVAALPIESPDDGFSGADHDQLLYGKP